MHVDADVNEMLTVVAFCCAAALVNAQVARNVYTSRSSPRGALAFQEESEEKLIRLPPPLIPVLLRCLFLLKKICVSLTLALQSLETPLQTM